MSQNVEEYGVLIEEDKIFLQNQGFEVICNIGSSFDHLVFKARTQSGTFVAIKYLEITSKRKLKYLERETQITDFLRDNPHKNIIKIFLNIKIEEQNKVFTVMEFGDGGDLVTFFTKRKWTPIKESLARDWFTQLMSGVKWLHDKGIAHRDIKSDNVILFRTGDSFILKLTDLEMAIFGVRRVGRFVQTIKCNTVCGSIEYAAPEIFTTSYNPFLADIYSLGVILYVFISGISPFRIYGSELLSVTDRINRTLEMKTKMQFNIPDSASDSVKNLTTRMLEPNPENRIHLLDIISSEWVVNDPDFHREFWDMFEET